MDLGAPDPAEILEDSIEHQDHVRRTLSIEVEPSVLRLAEDRLDQLRDVLAERVGMTLGPREGTGFLRYLPGGFYLPHRDRGDLPSWPGASRRQLAVVVFLNSADDPADPDAFSGGRLWLYPEDREAVEIRPQAGRLVAFPATLLHEVTVVSGGVRDVVVDWFY
jgi:predicted 2-oxoglutarate/Fe(II)-dependent dioxygenase YbiX